MPKYINTTDLKQQIVDFKKCFNSPNSDYLTGYLCALSMIEGIIAEQLEFNGFEIVRCKDCGFCKHTADGYLCKRILNITDGEHFVYNNPDDYCSYGERKNDNA